MLSTVRQKRILARTPQAEETKATQRFVVTLVALIVTASALTLIVPALTNYVKTINCVNNQIQSIDCMEVLK